MPTASRSTGNGIHPGIRSGSHTAGAPTTTTNSYDRGGPHNERASRITIDNGGQMDGAVRALEPSATPAATTRRIRCRQAKPGPNGTPDVMGYHTAQEIPNYWAYAKQFLLQDRMFAPADSCTLPVAPLPGVGVVRDVPPAIRCRVAPTEVPRERGREAGAGRRPTDRRGPTSGPTSRGSSHEHGVSWAYYVGADTLRPAAVRRRRSESTGRIRTRCPGSRPSTPRTSSGTSSRTSSSSTAASNGTLPSVSWVMPRTNASEHPPDYDRERAGMGDEGRERRDAAPPTRSTRRSSSPGTTGAASTTT